MPQSPAGEVVVLGNSTPKRASNGSKRLTSVERFLPLGYFVMALLLVLVVLPTILRPPPEQATTSAELSPDAPPDDKENAIVASFTRASSGTAGAGEGAGVGEPGEALGPGGGPGPGGSSACPRGIGIPPRQTESVYSPPCAVAFTGDNGGATYPGVTRDEIRIVVGRPGDNGPDGPVPRQAPAGVTENAQQRTWRAWQAWLNQRYQFYGRYLQLYVVNSGESPSDQQAGVAKAAEEYKVFGGFLGRYESATEMARRKMLAFGLRPDHYPNRWLADKAPYAYSAAMDTTRLVNLAAEYYCHHMKGKPAAHAGIEFQQTMRRVGIVYLDHGPLGVNGPDLQRALESCGVEVAESIGFTSANVVGAQDAQSVGTAITRLRSAGVTTVLFAIDWVTMAGLTNSAANQGYQPEWMTTGMLGTDVNETGRLMHPEQWSRAFGITGFEVERPDTEHDGYRAFKEIVPDAEPNQGILDNGWMPLEQIANGLQMAGPNLTPQTFREGLFRMGHRDAVPRWSMAGGYDAGDLSFTDKACLIWWDNLATDANGEQGAFRFLADARRFGPGEMASAPETFFAEGVSTPPPG